MNKYFEYYLYNGTFHTNEDEWTNAMWSNKDGSYNQNVEQRELDTKEYIFVLFCL